MRQAQERQRRYQRSGAAQAMHWEEAQAYGEWFERLPWDWFATFTVKPGAYATAEYLHRLHRRWSGSMHTLLGRQLRQVLAVEFHKSGQPHAHALVHGVDPVRADVFDGMARWERVSDGAISRIWPYMGQGGAASYCAKYVTKDGDVSLIGPWPRRTA